MGRKIDLLVVSLWQSRGFELDAVEVKVCMSDWKRELENAAKADWWWKHTHRFWVAVPAVMADKVKAELPSTWGLIACGDQSSLVIVKAPKRTPEPLPWSTCIGVMRASADAGHTALQRAEQRGHDQGVEVGKREAERQSGKAFVKAQLDNLRQVVQDFEEAAGLKIDEYSSGAIGRAVALVQRWSEDPALAADRLKRLSEQISRQGAGLAALSDVLRAEMQPGVIA